MRSVWRVWRVSTSGVHTRCSNQQLQRSELRDGSYQLNQERELNNSSNCP